MVDMEAAGEAIVHSTDQAAQAGLRLDEIVNIVSESNDQIRSIATASEEQASVAEQIGHAVMAVSTVAEDTSRGMRTADATLQKLLVSSDEVSTLIETLRKGECLLSQDANSTINGNAPA